MVLHVTRRRLVLRFVRARIGFGRALAHAAACAAAMVWNDLRRGGGRCGRAARFQIRRHVPGSARRVRREARCRELLRVRGRLPLWKVRASGR